MRPSFVRSKSAPHSSSSSTRSGDSCACSWAMRQLFISLPPRMVSRKWTSQESSFQTFRSAAAMPPSAMTVCALPKSDLQMSAVRAPCALASMAARIPAPPAPMTTTSYSCRWMSSVTAPPSQERSGFAATSRRAPGSRRRRSRRRDRGAEDDAGVDDPAHRDQADVEVGQAEGEEGEPGEERVLDVQLVHLIPQPVAERRAPEAVEVAAAEVAAGVAGEGVEADEDNVRGHDQAAQPDAEPEARVVGRREDVGEERVVGEDRP